MKNTIDPSVVQMGKEKKPNIRLTCYGWHDKQTDQCLPLKNCIGKGSVSQSTR